MLEPAIFKNYVIMIESILPSVIIASIVGLATWIFKQSGKILVLESRVEELTNRATQERAENDAIRALAHSMDAKIDKRISESNSQLKELLTELRITLSELNISVGYLNKEMESIKHDAKFKRDN